MEREKERENLVFDLLHKRNDFFQSLGNVLDEERRPFPKIQRKFSFAVPSSSNNIHRAQSEHDRPIIPDKSTKAAPLNTISPYGGISCICKRGGRELVYRAIKMLIFETEDWKFEA